MLATAVGSLASTLERFLRFSGFYLLSAAFEGTAAAATALMTEPIVTETQARREKQTFRDLPGQLARLARENETCAKWLLPEQGQRPWCAVPGKTGADGRDISSKNYLF